MTPISIPIMTIRLLDLQLPREQYAEINFIGAAKDLLRDHAPRTQAAGIDLELFHNQEVTYSSIQLDRYQNVPEWTAYGEKAVETLWFWLSLFRERHPDLLKNSIVIQEHYTPTFLPQQNKYQLHQLVLSKSVSKELQYQRSPKKQKQRLEKYLYGNILRFLSHIGYSFDKDAFFLKVNVHNIHSDHRKVPIFKQQIKKARNLTFDCNFRLPQTLRLGQSTALGYGKLVHI